MPKIRYKTFNKVKTKDLPGNGLDYIQLARIWTDQENCKLFIERRNIIMKMFKDINWYIRDRTK